jgi:IS30 family transposase
VDVKQIQKLRSAGASWRDVADQLGQSKDTLRRAVARA